MKLKIDEKWQVEIPLELREKYNLKKNAWVDVHFDQYSDSFECLLETLAHDGVLINIPLN